MLEIMEPAQLRVAQKYELIVRSWSYIYQLLRNALARSRVVVRPYE